MRIRWSSGVYSRSSGDENLICNPRTSGCTVLKNCEAFIDAIPHKWADMREVEHGVAEMLGCMPADVHEDVQFVIAELRAQGFVDTDGFCEDRPSAVNKGGIDRELNVMDSANSPFAEFCIRHRIAAELHLDLTDACTEKCVHCYVPQKVRHFLPYEQVDKVLREFRAQNGFTVYLTGGECMLHPDFKKICRLCVELNLNMVVMTNLTCCDNKMVRFLREVDPQYLNVSLYSMKASEHDAVTRLPGSWQKTMAAILACEKAGVHIRVATPLLKENQGAFAELKIFADEHHMHLIPSCDIVARTDHDCSNMEHACSCSELRGVLEKHKEIFDRGWDGILPKCDAKVCDIGTSRLYVNAKGDYYPCDSMHGYVLGNVATHTVTEVWKGDKLTYLRGLKNRDFGKCASCENRPWCKVCPAANFNAMGDLFRPHESACARAAVIREVFGKGE